MARGISGRSLGGTSSLGQPVFAISTSITTVEDGTFTIGPEEAEFDFDLLGAFYFCSAAGTGSDLLSISIVDAGGTSVDVCTAFDMQYDIPAIAASVAQADEATHWVRMKDDVSLTIPRGGKLTATLAGGAKVAKVTALCVGR